MKLLLSKKEFGAWLPQEFAIVYKNEVQDQMGMTIYNILRHGPENKYYHDAWVETLRTVEIDGKSLVENDEGVFLDD